jgi:hypothetical protein
MNTYMYGITTPYHTVREYCFNHLVGTILAADLTANTTVANYMYLLLRWVRLMIIYVDMYCIGSYMLICTAMSGW